jgi:hypothetical protein
MPFDLKKIFQTVKQQKFQALSVILGFTLVGLGVWLVLAYQQQGQLNKSYQELLTLQQTTQAELETIKNTDQVLRNDQLEEEIEQIQQTFTNSIARYEEILKLKDAGVKTQALDKQFTAIITLLADRNYASASADLAELDSAINAEQAKLAVVVPIPANVPQINEAPGSGYRQQSVATELGDFLVDVIAADLNSTRVIVDTASDADCRDNCPVDALANYVSRSGGFAGINGPYFCPAEYPSCAGKTNSFDTLLMNKNKVYFNSDNNVYSNVPAVIFSGGSARYVGASSQWGRDTSPDSVIASQPMVLSGGNVSFGGDGDPKKGSRGSRSFIGSKGSTVYIGVVRGATVAEVGYVLKAMGLENALNLDSGGSTALFANGRYLAGPGRNTPFGIVFVRR